MQSEENSQKSDSVFPAVMNAHVCTPDKGISGLPIEPQLTHAQLLSAYTELKITHAELQSSNKALRSVIEAQDAVIKVANLKFRKAPWFGHELIQLLADKQTGIATIFVDKQLRIVYLTPWINDIIKRVSGNPVKSLGDIELHLPDVECLVLDVQAVLDTQMPREREIQITASKCYTMRIDVCIRQDGVLEGVVITMVDISERKQSDLALSAAEKQYHSVLSGLSEGVVSYRRNGTIEAWNPSAERILGLSGDQLLGRAPLDPRWRAIHEDGSPFHDDSHPGAEVFRTGLAQSNVVVGVHKADESLTWILINAMPIFRADDTVLSRVVISFSDITERKRVKDKLRLSYLALKAISQGVLITSPDEFIISANEAFTAITGYHPNEIMGKNCRFLQGQLTDMQTVNKIRQALKSKMSFSCEILNYRKNGSAFWNELSISPVRNKKGELTHFIGITRDVTERKQSLDKIRQFSLALEQSPEMVVITNTDAIIEYVNEVFVHSTGYSREEVIGKNPRLLGSGQTPFNTYVELWSALIQGQPWRGKLSNRRKDGSEYIESAVITPLRQPDGKVTHYVAVKHDITEQLRLEAEMNQYRFRLEEIVLQRTMELTTARKQAEIANNAKSRFLAATSHDLRQPLSALSLYVGVLKRNINSDNEKLVSHIQDCVDSLSELLTNLLDMSKLDAQVITPELADFSIDALFNTLISIHTAEAELKGLSLRVRHSGIYARTDQGLLQRIVGNLLSNAIQQTNKGGVLVTCRRHRGKQWIEVWDTGIGISEDKYEVIFEEFRQLGDDARTRGSGLGLSIVAKAARLLGLEIRLRSRPGRGSLFAIELPLGRMITSPVTSIAQPEVRPLRIGLVDDNVDVLQALALTLKSVGHEVIAAPNGKALLKKLDQHTPDLIISDYRLAAGETGFDVIALVRDVFGRELPAFIITGDTDPALVRSMASHDIAVQYKPLQLASLQTFIKKATEQRPLQ